MEDEILEVRRRLFNAKQAAAFGTVEIASDIDIYGTLEDVKKELGKRKNET